jgi:hypothetical protein
MSSPEVAPKSFDARTLRKGPHYRCPRRAAEADFEWRRRVVM